MHQLALALGRTVGELETVMTPREFYDWQVFLARYPLPVDVLDLHGAMHTATLFNINRGRDSPIADYRDYLVQRLPSVEKPKPQQSMAQRMRAVTEGKH